MDKTDVAHALEQIAACLDLKGENPFRVRAYQSAARAIAAYGGDLRQALADGTLAEMKGIGPATLEIIDEVLVTGRSATLDELRDQIPPGLVEMLQISGLGVAKVRQIHDALHIDSIAELEEAAIDGRLAKLPRFGKKTAEKILKGIEFLRQVGGLRLYHHARDEAQALAHVLAGLPGVRRAEIVGSVRRHCEVIRDLDVVLVVDGPPELLYERLGDAPGVTEFVHRHEHAVTLRFQSGAVADIFLSSAAELGFAMVRATGNEDHLTQLGERATARGFTWGERGLARDGRDVPAATEEALYEIVGLPWIPPELREGRGEVEAASAGRLPDLVTHADLKGFLHFHSTYSDGTTTIDEWAAAGLAAGYEYLGLTDHSQAAAYAGGLKPDDIARQHAEVDAANAAHPGVRLLKGVEADILQDGSLDYTPEIRASFDFVIASIHSRFGLDEKTMTARVLKAMDDPTMTILGHPTGRLLLSRDPYPLDLERIFRVAADRGIAIEINADPQRLDLDWRMVREATAMGVTISLGADAHNVGGMTNMEIGIGIARKGWLTRDQLLNARGLEGFLDFVKRRHGKR